MDSDSTREFLAASTECESALHEWLFVPEGQPQLVVWKVIPGFPDVSDTVRGFASAIAAVDGTSKDFCEFHIWPNSRPIIRATAHEAAADVLCTIGGILTTALHKMGYDERGPVRQPHATRSFFDPSNVTAGDWAYAHQDRLTETLQALYPISIDEGKFDQSEFNEVEFWRLRAQMQRERALLEGKSAQNPERKSAVPVPRNDRVTGLAEALKKEMEKPRDERVSQNEVAKNFVTKGGLLPFTSEREREFNSLLNQCRGKFRDLWDPNREW